MVFTKVRIAEKKSTHFSIFLHKFRQIIMVFEISKSLISFYFVDTRIIDCETEQTLITSFFQKKLKLVAV
jgi:hypothetical protein